MRKGQGGKTDEDALRQAIAEENGDPARPIRYLLTGSAHQIIALARRLDRRDDR